MKKLPIFTAAILFLIQTVMFGQQTLQVRALVAGSYYNNNDVVYVPCGTGSTLVQIQYNYQGTWYATSHYNVDSAPSGWNWTFLPTNQTNKTEVLFSYNNPNNSGQVAIAWGAIGLSDQFRLDMRSTPRIEFTSVPGISSSNSSNTYSVYANTNGNVDWTTYGDLKVNGSNNYCCNQSATISTLTYGGLLVVTASNSCGTSPPIYTSVYKPFVQNVNVNGSNSSGNVTVPYVASLYLNTVGTATSADWVVTNGNGSISPYGVSCNAYPNNFLRVVGTATNQYGPGGNWTFYIFKDDYSPYRMAYPNPAKDQVTLEFEDMKMAEELLSSINLLDEKGESWREFNSKETKNEGHFKQERGITFNVKDLPRGTYFMHIKLADKLYKERIVIE